ncbi:hypothetical protein BHM03_00062622, partial [Ensete ventricosum]
QVYKSVDSKCSEQCLEVSHFQTMTDFSMVLLDKRSGTSIVEMMQEYQVIAMVIISG